MNSYYTGKGPLHYIRRFVTVVYNLWKFSSLIVIFQVNFISADSTDASMVRPFFYKQVSPHVKLFCLKLTRVSTV